MTDKITTDDCKAFLVQHFQAQNIVVLAKDFKRTSKYKHNEIWHRDFSHPEHGTICLVEKDGQLEIGSSPSKVNKSDFKYYKTFSEQEFKDAKFLLKDYLKRLDSDESRDDDFEDRIFKGEKFKQIQHAMPSQFTFYFPLEDYENLPHNVSNGLDTFILVDSDFADSFVVNFEDRYSNDTESYSNNFLRFGVLPSWCGFADETNLEFDPDDTPEDFTVRDIVKMLFDLGFEYKVGEAGCLFEKEIKNYIKNLKIEHDVLSMDDHSNLPKNKL